MTINSPIVTPRAVKGWVSHNSVLGTNSYDLTKVYSPDTAVDKSCVLDLASPKYNPHPTTIFDKSGYNNHGTLTGATWVRLPSGLWVNSFDAVDDFISCGTGASLNITGDLTIMVWIKRTDHSTYDTLVIKGAEAVTPFELIFMSFGDAGNHDKFFYLHTKDGGGSQQVLSADDTFVLNRWHLLTLTRDALGNINIYRNGELDVAPTATSGTPVSNAVDDVVWGQRSDGYRWHGYQGRQRQFNRALSATEISQIYQNERAFFNV